MYSNFESTFIQKNQKKALWEGSMTKVKNDLMDVMIIRSFSKIGASFPYSLYSPPSTKKASRGAVLVAKLNHQVRLLFKKIFSPPPMVTKATR